MELRTAIFILLRAGAGTLFLVAGVLKAAAWASFNAEIRQYDIVPYGVVPFVSVFILLLEAGCGIALIIDCWTKPSAWILSALVAVFLFALSARVASGKGGDCGCFGDIVDDPIGAGALTRDALLLVVCLIIANRGGVLRTGRHVWRR